VSYDKWLTIEGFGFSLGALSAAASIWRDLAASPDDIALHGAAFLRDQLALPSN
jgi:D-psicose/D-tagatose/L-ribulose 3-epimerase